MKSEYLTSRIKRILFRCDAAPQIGFGHVVRCLALADELRDQHGCDVAFAMIEGPLGVAQVQEHGYVVYQPSIDLSKPVNESAWLQSVVREIGAQALVLDVRTDLPVEAIQEVRQEGVVITTIDDPSDRRLAADYAFYPPVTQVERFNWSGFTGKCLVGWDWILLRREFAESQKNLTLSGLQEYYQQNPKSYIKILVTMGGSDPAGFTRKALFALDQINEDFEVIVALGHGYTDNQQLECWLAAPRRHPYRVVRAVRNMVSVMTAVDYAIASFGVTAYELAAIGVPTIYLCLSEDHAESAAILVEENMGYSMGYHQNLPVDQLRQAVIKILLERSKRSTNLAKSMSKIDGKGAKRIALTILGSSPDINQG